MTADSVHDFHEGIHAGLSDGRLRITTEVLEARSELFSEDGSIPDRTCDRTKLTRGAESHPGEGMVCESSQLRQDEFTHDHLRQDLGQSGEQIGRDACVPSVVLLQTETDDQFQGYPAEIIRIQTLRGLSRGRSREDGCVDE